jgi:predicted PurR-regulated permease PerM
VAGDVKNDKHWLYQQPWTLRWGITSIMLLAIAGVVVVVGMIYDKAHQVALPLAIAVIVGLLLEPLVEFLVRHHFPRWLATVLTMILIIVVLTGILALIIYGIATQAGAIEQQVTDGIQQMRDWFNNLDIEDSTRDWINNKIGEVWPHIQNTLTNKLTATVPGLANFLLGSFIGFFILIFLLGDDGSIKRFVGDHLGVSRARGEAILDEVTASVRGYFKGTTIIATMNALVIIPVCLILKVPLVAPISLVTFVTCYIPSFGGYIGGAFAVIIAFASRGVTAGIVMLIFAALSHTVLQGPVQAIAYGKTLNINPLVALLVTLLGAVFAGIAGAILAVPVTAVAIKVSAMLKRAREEAEEFEEGLLMAENSTVYDPDSPA